MSGALPNLLVVGAQKCGTTSLHHYLGVHPQIGMSTPKELRFFTHHRNQGLDWYRSHFDPALPIRGETSPSYTDRPRFPPVAGPIVDLLGDVRIVYLVRDPLARALAGYAHAYAAGREDRVPDEALADPEADFVARSCYAFQLEPYLDRLPRDRILIIDQEELLTRRLRTLGSIFSWLGVDPDVRDRRFRRRHHRTSRKRRRTARGERLAATPFMRRVATLPDPWRWIIEDVAYRPFSRGLPELKLAAKTLDAVLARLAPDAERFRLLTGKRFENWSV